MFFWTRRLTLNLPYPVPFHRGTELSSIAHRAHWIPRDEMDIECNCCLASLVRQRRDSLPYAHRMHRERTLLLRHRQIERRPFLSREQRCVLLVLDLSARRYHRFGTNHRDIVSHSSDFGRHHGELDARERHLDANETLRRRAPRSTSTTRQKELRARWRYNHQSYSNQWI